MEPKEASAYLRYVRISPRKVQIVCDLIRGKDVGTAMSVLMHTPKAASELPSPNHDHILQGSAEPWKSDALVTHQTFKVLRSKSVPP